MKIQVLMENTAEGALCREHGLSLFLEVEGRKMCIRDRGEHPNIQNEAGLKVSWWSTLLKKTTFRRLAARFKEGKNE